MFHYTQVRAFGFFFLSHSPTERHWFYCNFFAITEGVPINILVYMGTLFLSLTSVRRIGLALVKWYGHFSQFLYKSKFLSKILVTDLQLHQQCTLSYILCILDNLKLSMEDCSLSNIDYCPLNNLISVRCIRSVVTLHTFSDFSLLLINFVDFFSL